MSLNPDTINGFFDELDAIEKQASWGAITKGLGSVVGRAAKGVRAIRSGVTGQGVQRAARRAKGFIGPMPLQKGMTLTPEMRRKAIMGGMKAMAPAATIGAGGLLAASGAKRMAFGGNNG